MLLNPKAKPLRPQLVPILWNRTCNFNANKYKQNANKKVSLQSKQIADVFGLLRDSKRYEPITVVFATLHWLPVTFTNRFYDFTASF